VPTGCHPAPVEDRAEPRFPWSGRFFRTLLPGCSRCVRWVLVPLIPTDDRLQLVSNYRRRVRASESYALALFYFPESEVAIMAAIEIVPEADLPRLHAPAARMAHEVMLKATREGDHLTVIWSSTTLARKVSTTLRFVSCYKRDGRWDYDSQRVVKM
jgi:hypothetical protein